MIFRILTTTATTLLLVSVSLSAQQLNTDLTELKPSEQPKFTLVSGENLHIIINKGFMIKGRGQSFTATITQPLYVGEQAVIAPGTLVHGHIVSLNSAGAKAQVFKLFDGDLTKPRVASVTFDDLVGIDGKSLPLETEETYGQEGMKFSMTRSHAQSKQGFKGKISAQLTGVIKAPNKLQRVTETLVTGLPYHPLYIDEGTVFNATLKHSLDLPSVGPALWTTPLDTSPDPQFLHLRLLTVLNSDSNHMHDSVEAIVSVPFYDAQHHLLYPTGYRVAGTVKTADPAKWFHRQGALRFDFESAVLADGNRPRFSGQIVGVEASKSQGVNVDAEGGMKATSSHLRQASALASLVGPSQGLADSSLAKTAWSRAGNGRKGLGLIGSGAAQASASTAIGLGYYGAAKRVYASFIAKGTAVELPVNTALLLDLK